MPTWGYAIIATLIAVLAAYTLWPASGSTGVTVFPAKISEPFSVTGELGEQRVEAGRITVAGLDRPAEAQAVTAFAATATAIKIAPNQVIEGIDAQAARAWGIDGSRRLVVGEQERQWGEADGTAAVWDPRTRRVFLLPPAELRRLAQAAARLDARPLIELKPEQPLDWLLVDGVRFARISGAWRFPGDLRPRASGRVDRLVAALRDVRLGSLAGAPAEAQALHELRLPGLVEERLRLLGLGERRWLERAGTPAQELTPAEVASWTGLLAALGEDRLLDPPGVGSPETIVVSRGGVELFRLMMRGSYGSDGKKPWEVHWPGGAEPAAAEAGTRIQNALLGLVITGAEPGPEPIWAGATTISVTPEYGSPLRAILGKDRAWADGWSGRIAQLPEILARLGPDTCFDLHPLPTEPGRVVKLQRRWPAEAARDEVHARAAGGSWARTHPVGATPADPLAVDRLVRSLVRLTARSVRLATPADKALPATAELAVRIAPVKLGTTGADDDVILEDTVPQERAWRLAPEAASDRLLPTGQTWLMVDVIGGLAFTLDAADAEALLADVASTRLFPLAPSLVSAVEVVGAHSFRLARSGAAWTLRQAGNETPADAIAARRLLRALAALDARGPAAVPAGEGTTIVIETGDGERLSARVRVLAPGEVAAQTESGGVRLDADAWAQVALDPAAYAAGPR
jgi:hypothetical protein